MLLHDITRESGTALVGFPRSQDEAHENTQFACAHITSLCVMLSHAISHIVAAHCYNKATVAHARRESPHAEKM